MNTSFDHGSAKIYQFPAGGRSALGGRRPEQTRTGIDVPAPRISEVACGAGWYHEAAILESNPVRER